MEKKSGWIGCYVCVRVSFMGWRLAGLFSIFPFQLESGRKMMLRLGAGPRRGGSVARGTWWNARELGLTLLSFLCRLQSHGSGLFFTISPPFLIYIYSLIIFHPTVRLLVNVGSSKMKLVFITLTKVRERHQNSNYLVSGSLSQGTNPILFLFYFSYWCDNKAYCFFQPGCGPWHCLMT